MNAKISGKKSPIRLEFLVGCIWVVILAAIAGGVSALFLVPGLNPFTPQPTPIPVIPTDTPTPTATATPTALFQSPL